MLVDLVQAATMDGLRLHGALELPSGGESGRTAIDAWLCIHGTGSNFYSASTLAGLTPKLLAGGAAVLRGNTRGHDIVCTGPSAEGRSMQGSAFERVDEAPHDLAAWVALLAERGFTRVGLLGHSLGAIKAIFALATEKLLGVTALVAVSPPRLCYSHFLASRRADGFRQSFRAAQELIAAGRGDELLRISVPIPSYITAECFVDRYGPAERYDVLKLLDRVPIPTLVTYGSRELLADVAFEGMSESVAKLATDANRLKVAVIADADHVYTACHDSLAAQILAWANRLDH